LLVLRKDHPLQVLPPSSYEQVLNVQTPFVVSPPLYADFFPPLSLPIKHIGLPPLPPTLWSFFCFLLNSRENKLFFFFSIPFLISLSSGFFDTAPREGFFPLPPYFCFIYPRPSFPSGCGSLLPYTYLSFYRSDLRTIGDSFFPGSFLFRDF